ncbi:MAG: hypothetical protein ABSG95_13035 [Solirubrobacteraceae bacterium]|jgi:uncharacterized protein YhaN
MDGRRRRHPGYPAHWVRGTNGWLTPAALIGDKPERDRTAGRAPLLLDGHFAHFAAERLRLGVELIAEVTECREVILFTG